MQALSQVAWADGVLKPSEAKFFTDVIVGLEAGPEVAAEAFGVALRPGSVDDLNLSELDDDDRRWVLGFGFLMAKADGEVADSEMEVLRSLAGAFGVEWSAAEALFAEAETMLPTVRAEGGTQ